MGLAPHQTRSVRLILAFSGFVTCFMTWLRFHEPRLQGKQAYDPAVVAGQKVSGEQRLREEQEILKEDLFQESIQDIMNATLGFNKVLAINIPSRTDKRDQLVLGSSLTGFVIDFVDGVTPKDLNPKTYPYNWNHMHSATEYACLRAHLNTAQRIVGQGLRTALVLEDDVDWDISIKSQLQTFALAVRTLQGTAHTHTQSPYGDEWDILWLGHCGASCKTELPFYMIPNDPTRPKSTHLPNYYHDPPENVRSDNARLVCAVQDAACMPAYAMSYSGAQRILAALSVNPSGFVDQLKTGDQIDLELGRMCKSGLLRCFAPYPSLMGTYQSAGLSSKGTDQSGHEHGAQFEPATSWGLVYSTMLNIKHLLQGERVIHATLPDAKYPIINPEDIHFERGYVYTYKPEDYPESLSTPEEVVLDETVFADEPSLTDEPYSISWPHATREPHLTKVSGFKDLS